MLWSKYKIKKMFEKLPRLETPPIEAEKLTASDFQRIESKPSKFAAGCDVETYYQTCPSCAAHIKINHGQQQECKCGLVMQLYGNQLTVWKR